MSLVLASASASRSALLKAAGVSFHADPADLDEDTLMAGLRGSDAATIAATLAQQKALHVSARHPGKLVLGGDSVIGFGDEMLSKCATLEEARALLRLALQYATWRSLVRESGLETNEAVRTMVGAIA